MLERPRRELLVAVLRRRREDDAALVVRAALRRRERTAQQLAALRRRREVFLGREVVEPHLLVGPTACKVQRIGDGTVAVARRAARGVDDAVDVVFEVPEVGARGILREIEVEARGQELAARQPIDGSGRRTGVVLGRAVLDPTANRLICGARRIEDRSAGVLDVRRDLRVLAVERLHVHREGVDVLHEERRLPVRAVVREQVSAFVHASKGRGIEISKRISPRVRDVTARTGVRAHARGGDDRADRAFEIRRLRRLLRIAREGERSGEEEKRRNEDRSHAHDPISD